MKSIKEVKRMIKGFYVTTRTEMDKSVFDDVLEIRKRRKQIKAATTQPIIWRIALGIKAGYLVAALLIVFLGVTCVVLVRRNMTLELNLRLARQEIELLHSQEQIADATDNQQQAISELDIRVRKLEKQVKLSISPGMVWYSESAYYPEEWPGEL
jgi:hypothetical protein